MFIYQISEIGKIDDLKDNMLLELDRLVVLQNKDSEDFFQSLHDDFFAVGFYNHPHKYYCVWLENQTQKEIIDTENHEICHHLVHENYEHFCGDYFINYTEIEVVS